MKKILLAILISTCYNSLAQMASKNHFETIFEASKGTKTATYEQVIQFYSDLANAHKAIDIQEIGKTDSGKPLHLVTFNPDSDFNFKTIRKNKRVILINNGIHPGESDGIDATMMLFRDLVNGRINPPKHLVLTTIPIYNIGGSLNRNSTTRTNQNGPEEYGFRGNARNYDLNRDFIKCDTENAKSFAQIFHLVQPDIFVDNHVSNGADYQYKITHLFTQHDKLGGDLGDYLQNVMQPAIERSMLEKGLPMTPYVNVFNQVPEKGFSQFLDSPRYSTGYTTLFNTLGLMVETHMLKPYKERVYATYELMKSLIDFTENQQVSIAKLRTNYWKTFKTGDRYALDWTIDSLQQTTLDFKGYEGTYETSKITGAKRLKYDRTQPFTKPVEYFNHFKAKAEITIPKAYVVPQGWHDVIDLLKLNNISMTRFKTDTTLTVASYKIVSYDTKNMPYEGHYQHYNTKVKANTENKTFKAGDYMIDTHQPGIRYLLETLEPEGPDSFFNWNFFDTILQQKEHFSPYVWEDKVLELMQANPKLKTDFEAKKFNDQAFANNWYAQLDWWHKHSKYYEKAHMQYPVYRIR